MKTGGDRARQELALVTDLEVGGDRLPALRDELLLRGAVQMEREGIHVRRDVMDRHVRRTLEGVGVLAGHAALQYLADPPDEAVARRALRRSGDPEHDDRRLGPATRGEQ